MAVKVEVWCDSNDVGDVCEVFDVESVGGPGNFAAACRGDDDTEPVSATMKQSGKCSSGYQHLY